MTERAESRGGGPLGRGEPRGREGEGKKRGKVD